MGSIVNKKNHSNISSCIKRCSVEMLDLYENYDFKSIQTKLFSTNEVHFIIEDFEGKVLKFILSERYPFIEPKLMINEQLYKNILLQNSNCERINKVLKKNQVDCMCCASIICYKNWSPAYRMENVLFEITQVKILKNYVKQYLMMDDICRKKNIDTDTIGNYILEFLLDNPFDGPIFCKVK
jgi:ubiquitin-protein ligase